MKCPKCNLEINEDILYCPMCQTELLEELETDAATAAESEPESTAFLMTAKDELQVNIVESLLKVYGIPLRRKYKGDDTFGKIFMGLTMNGIDLYVPNSSLEEAMDIIKNELPEEEITEYETETEAEIEKSEEELLQKYNKKRRIIAWIVLLFFAPGIVQIIGIIIRKLIDLFTR